MNVTKDYYKSKKASITTNRAIKLSLVPLTDTLTDPAVGNRVFWGFDVGLESVVVVVELGDQGSLAKIAIPLPPPTTDFTENEEEK